MNAVGRITLVELSVLRQYKLTHGRRWKNTLLTAWMTGIYDDSDNTCVLQQIRNTLGPTWLVNIRGI